MSVEPELKSIRPIGRDGGSDKKVEISTTNLFNSVILLFNPSLMPLLFSLGQSVDGCHSGGEARVGVGGGTYQNKVEVRWIRAGLEQTEGKDRGAVKEEGWRVYGAAAVSSLDLQCEGDGL